MGEKTVNCLTCKYYYISWDVHFPYGCKAMGFKSRKMPLLEILQISGQQCLSYCDKTKRGSK